MLDRFKAVAEHYNNLSFNIAKTPLEYMQRNFPHAITDEELSKITNAFLQQGGIPGRDSFQYVLKANDLGFITDEEAIRTITNFVNCEIVSWDILSDFKVNFDAMPFSACMKYGFFVYDDPKRPHSEPQIMLDFTKGEFSLDTIRRNISGKVRIRRTLPKYIKAKLEKSESNSAL